MKDWIVNNVRVIRVLVIATGAIIVFIAVKRTVNASFRYFEVTRELSQTYVPGGGPTLSSVENASLKDTDIDKSSFELFGRACTNNKVVIKKIEPALQSEESTAIIFTKEVIVQGSYIDILKCLNEVNKGLEGIKISSIAFFTEDHEKIKRLYARIYLQGIKLKRS